MRLKQQLDRMMGPELAVIVLVFSLLVTFTAWRVISVNEHKAAQLRFDFYKQSFLTKLTGQMKEYQQALRGAAGLFYASDEVSRSDWKHYVDTLDITKSYPGIQGMGFALHVPSAQKTSHVAKVKNEGLDYDIYPAGEREIYTPVLYLEPFDWRNQRALGFDLWSDKNHQEAMTRARDTGNMAVTHKLILSQETLDDTQVGFMMFAPVYKKGAKIETTDDRQKQIYGYVYSPFRMKNLMDAITSVSGNYLEVEVFDGKEAADFASMYRSNPKEKSSAANDFVEVIPVKVGEHDWTVVVKPGAAFDEYVRERESTYTLVSGIVISFLLFTVAWSLSTSRQRAIKLADKMTGDLRISEERYALAMAGSNDGLWDWNILDDILYLSPRFKKLLGYKNDDFENSRKNLEKHIHPDDFEKSASAISQHISKHIPLDIECRLRLKNNEYNWFRIKGQAIWDEHNTALRMAGSLSDINDRKLAAIYLQNQKQELEVANKYKSEFLANMSHELRTPLNSIMVLSSLLSDDREKTMNQKQREQAGIIYRSGAELLDLISEILDLSKIEAGKMEINLEKLSIEDFSQELRMIFEPVSADRGQTFEVVIDKNVPEKIVTDHKRIYQVVKNLASNAIKFTQKGGTTVRFFIPGKISGINDFLDPHDTLAISVEDTGIGIPKDKFSLIFEAFKQVDGTTSRKHGGTGLGLTISREILSLLKGGITVESKEGKGSKFTVYIPMNSNVEEAMLNMPMQRSMNQGIVEPQEENFEHDFEPLNARILLVDDDVRNIYALTALLERYNCTVMTAENGEEAMKILASEHAFDLIIMDMMMPVMDGYEATRRIKEDPLLQNIPVIALTAKAMPEDREKCMNAGADSYISKPVKCDDLAHAIKKHIKAKKV